MSPLRILCCILLLILPTTAWTSDTEVVLLDEDFSGLRTGPLFSVVGAHLEYHYLPLAGPKGNWHVSTFASEPESQRAWRVLEREGQRFVLQASQNRKRHTHPMLVTGDVTWRDLRMEVEMIPLGGKGRAGVAFRSRHDRCYYFFGVSEGAVQLLKVDHETGFQVPNETVLAEKELDWKPGEPLRLAVECRGAHLAGFVEGSAVFEVEDETFPEGKVLLTSDFPTEFHRVRITATAGEKERIDQVIDQRTRTEAELQDRNPKMKVWKKVSFEGELKGSGKLSGFGVGRNVRFGDLDSDGTTDILLAQVVNHGPKDRNSETGCLTAMTLEGKILWQNGLADPWRDHQTSDTGVQIHDLDGDGKTEVIYCRDFELVVAEGATGKTIRKVAMPETPASVKSPYNRFDRILGDCIFFFDAEGKGRASNILIKNRYSHFWVLNSNLEVLWSGECNTGHYPYAADVDGDGREELSIGYSLYDDDGTRLWTLDEQVQDHADGVALVRFNPEKGDPFRLLCAASDEGMFFADMEGNILKHHYIGHVQNPAVANFRDDLPGLETVSINFWGNQGIIHFFNSEGDILHDFEPCQHGSLCLPINWTGGSEEFFVLSPNAEDGGLFDGWGRRVVRFPADGHPELCNAVLDLTGDCRDEIVVWDSHEMWVYTQEDNPREGKLYAPVRNLLANYSNYQTTVSLPGWE